MSEITQTKDINYYVNEATTLKKDFMKAHKSDPKSAQELIRKLRIIHGGAIIADEIDKVNIIKKGNVTDDDKIKLSINASLLHVIHRHIRQCETTAYLGKEKMGISESDIRTSSPEKTSEYTKAITKGTTMNPVIKKKSDETDEISIQGIATETVTTPTKKYRESELFEADVQQVSTPTNTTEFLNRLTTTEAERMYSDYNKTQPVVQETSAAVAQPAPQTITITQQNGGNKDLNVDKPTIVNYWANWCPASRKFLPNWKEFKENAGKKFPELQVVELDVDRDEKLNELAKKAGVKGYPTVVLFNKGKKSQKIAGNATANDINDFVKTNIGAC